MSLFRVAVLNKLEVNREIMKGKVALVTGANSGTGKWTAIALAEKGARVVMLCRNQKRGEEALEEVKKLSKNQEVELLLCDLGSLESIRRFSKVFHEKYEKLDVLVNNAGVTLPKRQETTDGFELQFGVNHLGHFLLTNLLLDLILKSSSARIVVVSSGAHKVGKIDFNDLQLKKSFNLIKAYSQSKLANLLFTYELSRRLKDEKVTVNALHPGAVATNMGINRETGFGKLITKILRPFFQTPREGARTAVYLATSSEVEGVTGKYFYNRKPINSSKESYNEDLQKKLWQVSKRLVGLN